MNDLFAYASRPMFDGATYSTEFDEARLTGQLKDVYNLMAGDGKWRTLQEIYEVTGHSHQSVSARLRDLRKEKFGSHNVARRRRPTVLPESGLFEYRVSAPSSEIKG